MKIRNILKGASAPIAMSVALAAHPVLAQDAGDDAVSIAEADGVILVTGSRIARDANETAPSPVTSISIEDIRETGVVDITDALREIPALSGSGTVADSIDNGAGGIGQATLNLRGLGSVRTLVLVNGKRHVSGIGGSQVVDVATIPPALIQNVEVLTGGASAVYGADAVTGVVNYVLVDDFEGLAFNILGGLSDDGDGFTGSADLTFGTNFDDGRGNLTLSAGYNYAEELLVDDRPFSRDNRRFNNGTTYASPLRRFQRGDIGSDTPNFAQFFNTDQFRTPIGFSIPTAENFITSFEDEFGSTPTLTAAELALISQAADAPALSFQADPRFAISSNSGLIFRNDFGFYDLDLNNNGVQDCLDSFIGLTGFGGGGCYTSNPDGTVRVFEDGIVSSSSNQFGGDGAPEQPNGTTLIPESERIFLNALGSYEISDAVEVFFDAKYVRTETKSQNPYNTFYDTLVIFPDNPFIPDALQADANDAGGLRVSRDFTDLGLNVSTASRDTYRLVGGLRGEFGGESEFSWEVFGNYGRTESRLRQENAVLTDRLFASIDAVDRGEFFTGTPDGNIVCRSDVDPDARHPGSTTFPVIAPGIFTFNPGDGQCVASSLFNGEQSINAAAVDFITTRTTDRVMLEQLVFGGSLVGDTGSFFELPGGPVAFALGAEYREERSATELDALDRGIAPITTPDIQAGQFIGDVTFSQQLVFDGTTAVFNSGGEFDVKEVFGEISIPLLADTPFFEILEVSGAARFSEYSTVGDTFTWNVNGRWSPVEDITFRGTYSVAVRAPNISELFNPQQGTTFRPADPCDVAQIAVLDAADAANRQANCIADFQSLGANAADYQDDNGVYDYADPLTARFSGTTGGNPNLTEETATTYTFGAVVTPRWIPNLTITVDYYNIEIEDAIAAVASQDIVDTCYDSTAFPNQFCGQFSRIDDSGSQTFLGFNFLSQSQLNFGRVETSGIEGSVSYGFAVGDFDIAARGAVNWVDNIDRFFDPTDPTNVDPGLREEQLPEWAGTGSLSIGYDRFSVRYGVQYVGSQVLRGLNIETARAQAGDAAFLDATWVHDVSVSYDVTDEFTVFGGVNNLTEELPFPGNFAYPVNPYGRYLFLGASARFDGFRFR